MLVTLIVLASCAPPSPNALPTAGAQATLAATSTPAATATPLATSTLASTPMPPATNTPTTTSGPTSTRAPAGIPTATRAPIQHIYRFTDQAVSISDDGRTWQERPYRFANKIVSLAAALTDTSVVYVLTFEPLPAATQLRPVYRYVLFASRDAGQTWEPGATGELGGCYTVKATLQALPGPTAPPNMVSLNSQCVDNPSDSRGYGTGVRLSTDSGRTFVWSQEADGIQLAYTRDGILRFLPDRQSAALALSQDGGRTWQPLPLPPTLNTGGFPSAYPQLEIDARDPAHVTLRERTGNQPVWQSSDGGHSWSR